MADFPVGNNRDNLKLVPINKNGTISEMIETIDENFKNIAAHGGGPDGLPGKDGVNGTDGTSAQYIFALCDEELVGGIHYPTTDDTKSNLFDTVEMSASHSQWFPSDTNKKIQWFDHPQGVSKDHKNEYVFSRYKRTSGEDIWFYASKPELWAHWGETGKDGDGVEYIFMRSKTELDENTLKTIIKSKESMSGDQYQPIIYQMDDFFPGEEWFTGENAAKNKVNAQKAIIAKYGNVPSNFETLWSNKFNMIVPGYNWTDDPKGTDPIYVYEYVAIRRCNVDDEDGKEWSDFSTPAIWSHYGLSTRTIIIYSNKEGTTPPVQPQTGQGIWNESSGELALPDSLVDAGWSDTNTTPSENQITWMCSGIFDSSGKNVSWSKPMRITGKDGKNGEDGTTIEFIYVLSETIPEHPDPTTTSGKTETEKLFDDIEASTSKPKSVDRYGNTWFDRAQPISQSDPTEWVWSRRREKESDPWEYDDDPIIWAHWGEDGTDGDGVEYVFIVKNVESYPDDATSKANWNSNWNVFTDTNASVTAKAIYAMDDFYPGPSWFTGTNKQNVKDSMENPSNDFDENVWTQISTNMSALGNWTDNPENISATYKYQYVSIRKSVDGKWGAFSYPKLWAKYNLTSFKAFAFTSTPASAELGNLTFQAGISGTINNPLPIDANHTWTDGPNPTEQNPQVWMTSATIREDSLNTTTWAKPQRMTDNAEFQVEWSSDDITGTLLAEKILALKANTYNFGNYFTGNTTEDDAETAWRNAVNTGLGLTFGDSSNDAVLMATCYKSNGKWSNWDLVRVKGETGEAGTSINMKTPIIYEVYLDDNNYTIANARTKFNTVKSTLTTPTPSEGYLAVVYPHDIDTNDIYRGDPDLGNALYMCKYNGSAWVEYYNETTVSSTDEAPGDTHPSPNGHLILWDGDSWMDVGNIVGPAGPVSEILVKYAKDGATAGTHEFVPDNQPYTAKYVGFITYPAGERPDWSLDEDGVGPNGETWNWQLFKGQDGFGYEYIFKTTSTYSAPLIPQEPTGGNWSTTPNVIPGNGISDTTNRNYGWVDEPMEPVANSKYVWMCWRKYDHSAQTWTNFQGSTKTGHTNEARLWQVFANTITEVVEYFHADITMSPSDIDTPVTSTTYWKTDKSQCGWGASKKYLFNVEVIKFLDGNSQTLDPHLIAVWETGLIDVVDYYILEPANGSQGDGDPGETAPHMNGGVPVTSGSSNPGKNYWITSVPKMDKDFPVLWNISKKTYDGGKPEQWTTPIVIGVYGEGKNGEDSIYIDLTNEMDSVQIDKDNKVITARTCSTTVKLYKGEELLEIADLDIAGEEAITGDNDLSSITVTRTYHKGSTSSSSKIDSDYIDVTFTIPVGCELRPSHKIVFTVTSTEGIVRKTGYILVGTTHPAVYSIVPAASAVLVGENGNDPDPLRITVVKQTGSQLTSISGYSSSQGFKLNYQKNSGSKTELTNSPFSISTSNLSAGDKLTLTIDVDTDGNNTYETTIDRETIYALIQGKNGAKGEGGNGYRYYYARYVNDDSASYSGSTIPSLQSYASTLNTPVFLLNGVSLPGSSNAQGADGSHTFEYRTEKFFDGSNWSDWSNPITIAKYLTADNISQEIDAAVENATQNIQSDLSSALSRLNQYGSYLDPSTGIFTGTISETTATTLLGGYVTETELSTSLGGYVKDDGTLTTRINSAIGGYSVDISGTVKTFSDWLTVLSNTDSTLGTQYTQLNTVTTTLSASMGTLQNRVTSVESSLSNTVTTTAFDDFKVDSHDQFATMERTVANGKYLTDSEGYLLVNIPEYVVWFSSDSELDNSTYKDTDKNRDVKWVIYSGDLYDNDDPSTKEYIDSWGPFSPTPYNVSYDNLYNESKDKIMFVLEETVYVYDDDYQFISYSSLNLENYKPLVNSVEITYDIEGKDIYEITKNTSNLSLRVPFVKSSNGNITPDYQTSEGINIILLLYGECDLNNPSSTDGTKYKFTNINWNIGISSIASGGPDQNLEYLTVRSAHTKTGSIFETPLMISSYGEEDVFDGLDKYKQYGYTLTRVENSNYGTPVQTNGVATVDNENIVLLPVIKNVSTGEEWSVQDIMGYLNDSTTSISNSDLLTSISDVYVDESKSYYMLWKNSGGGDTLDEYTVLITGNNTVSFNSGSIFVNKHKLTSSSGFEDDGGWRTATGSGSTSKYDWYEMYVTSYLDEVIFDYDLTFTNSSDSSFVFCVDYYYGDNSSSTETINYVSGSYNGSQSFSDSGVSIFDNIDLESDETLHFRIRISPSSNTSTYDLRYRIVSSVNKILDTENLPIDEIKWNTDVNNNHKRYPSYGEGSYLIDKFTLNIGDRSRFGNVPYIKRRAKNKNGEIGAKNYIDVLDIEKPYLITSVSELATISQMVSNGIACTEIIAAVGDEHASAIFQATNNGSQIYLNANEIGIESDYFHLNNNGLTLTGNLLAKNSSGKITAGVIGDNLASGIKFFAGTNVSESATNFKNSVKNAKFRVYENGVLYAEDAIISGNITTNNISASKAYQKTINTINPSDPIYDDIYSITKTASIDANTFEIASTSQNTSTGSDPITSKIYITILDKFEADGDILGETSEETLVNVPVLCFEYDGHKFYLTPDVWKTFTPSEIVLSDVQLAIINSSYHVHLNNYTGPVYYSYMVWITVMGTNNTQISETIEGQTTVNFADVTNYTGDFDWYFGDNNTRNYTIQNTTDFLGKQVTLHVSITTPWDLNSFEQTQTFSMPNKSPEINVVQVGGFTFYGQNPNL